MVSVVAPTKAFPLLTSPPFSSPSAHPPLFTNTHPPLGYSRGSNVQNLACELTGLVPWEESTSWSLWVLIYKMGRVSLALSAFLGSCGKSDDHQCNVLKRHTWSLLEVPSWP